MAASSFARSTVYLSASRTRLSLKGGLSDGRITLANVPPGTAIASAPAVPATCENRSGLTSQIMSVSFPLKAVSSVVGSGKILRVTASR